MSRLARRLFASLTLLLLAGSAFAASADDNKVIFPGASAPAGASGVGGSGSLGSVTLVVALLIAAVGAWLFWRGRRDAAIGRDERLLAIDETRSLGNRQFLVVASYENKKFLIGVCPGRIDLLAPLHEAAPPENPRA